jgi:hypothetical protein
MMPVPKVFSVPPFTVAAEKGYRRDIGEARNEAQAPIDWRVEVAVGGYLPRFLHGAPLSRLSENRVVRCKGTGEKVYRRNADSGRRRTQFRLWALDSTSWL